jgi:hypothetical protein
LVYDGKDIATEVTKDTKKNHKRHKKHKRFFFCAFSSFPVIGFFIERGGMEASTKMKLPKKSQRTQRELRRFFHGGEIHYLSFVPFVGRRLAPR